MGRVGGLGGLRIERAGAAELRAERRRRLRLRVTNPEDLVLVPGTPWIVSSGMAEGAGFYLVDSKAGSGSAAAVHGAARPDVRELRDAADAAVVEHATGSNIRASGPGRAKLYVVGHGAREAIEVFDVDATGARPTLTWRGCVPMPEGLAANSVASFADGSLVATVLFMPGHDVRRCHRGPQANGGRVRVVARRRRLHARARARSCPRTTASRSRPTAARSTSRRRACRRSSRSRTAIPRGNCGRRGRCRSRPTTYIMGADGRLLTAGMANDVPECGGTPGREHDIAKLARARARRSPSRSIPRRCATR